MRRAHRWILSAVTPLIALAGNAPEATSQEPTRLLRQPSLSAEHIAFTWGSDVWVVGREGGEARRITSTPAVESDPHLSPDGRHIAFTSNRSGSSAVYVVGVEGGMPTRLTWHPSGAAVRGWSPDGARILYASSRGTAPSGYMRLWTVSVDGGPSEMIGAPWGFDGDFSADGTRIAVDRMSRWDEEFRSYRGGQNTPLHILDLETLEESWLPNEERTTDIQPVWMGDRIWFLSDRDWAMNVWSYDPASGALVQHTTFDDAEAKWLQGHDGTLAIEQDGWIHLMDTATGDLERVDIVARGDFPWMTPRWEDVTPRATAASLSPTGQRILMEARGEIFTAPVEHGDTRNLTRSSDRADRAPIWSPDGAHIAWISDDGEGDRIWIAEQDGMSPPRAIPLGESARWFSPAWSPDGAHIAFVDEKVRLRLLEVESGTVRTIDIGGTDFDRGSLQPRWSPDSQWLVYGKTYPNSFSRIVAWSAETGEVTALTDPMAHARAPAWDRNGKWLYFLASTDYGLASGWANTSTVGEQPTYTPYLMVLRADDETPFTLRSDEEPVDRADEEGEEEEDADAEDEAGDDDGVRIDFDGIDRRIIALPMSRAPYGSTASGPEGSVFITEGRTIHRFVVAEREAEPFARNGFLADVSDDGEKLLYRSGSNWHVVGTARPAENGQGRVDVELRMELDRQAEWQQMFEEAWRMEEEFFYAPNMHGADWDAVRERYEPLIPWVRHRADLNYVFDKLNGEMAVGHSFVGGGDYPAVDTTRVGMLGADFEAEGDGWRIARIYTYESWNPNLTAPLDKPGLEVEEGHYLVGVNGTPLTADDDPYRLLDGTAGRQTVIHLNTRPGLGGSWTETVEPIRSENALRQRAWVEDNRRRVDELSGGRLAYAWIPNTGGPGTSSFDRYVFAQQDKQGLVVDERYNGGGLLDDYMVDYMNRSLRGGLSTNVPGGSPLALPQGILGPKVLLINERAGSGGDYFPWAFRQQQVGPLIGMRTWGGLVNAARPYPMIDGGGLTAPAIAVFDPINGEWIAENEGVPPDIEVQITAASAAEGRDLQLEAAVREALRLLEEQGSITITQPRYSTPARRPGGGG